MFMCLFYSFQNNDLKFIPKHVHKGYRILINVLLLELHTLDLLSDFAIFLLLFVQNNKSTKPNWQ